MSKDVDSLINNIPIEDIIKIENPNIVKGLDPNLSVNLPEVCADIAIPIEVRKIKLPAVPSLRPLRLIKYIGTKSRKVVVDINPEKRANVA